MFTPIWGKARESPAVIGISRLPEWSQVPRASFRLLAIVSEPSWHRRKRLRRAAARKWIRKYVGGPTSARAHRAKLAINLLEAHHSKPDYRLARRVMSRWGHAQGSWTGNYWAGAWKSPKGKKDKDADKKTGKGRGKAKSQDEAPQDQFPAYDSMPPGSSSSGSASAPTDGDWKQLVKALVKTNSMVIPDDAKKLLMDEDAVDGRTELRKAQNLLNRKRKAHGKLLRLRETLADKHAQFQRFRERMKEQLLCQQDKYEEDVKSLEQAIAEAEIHLQNIEKETEDAKDEPMEGDNGPDLEAFLQMGDDKLGAQVISLDKELKQSKSETAATKTMYNLQAVQLQHYMQQVEKLRQELEAKVPAGSQVLAPGSLPSSQSPQQVRTPKVHRDDPLAAFGGPHKRPKVTETPKDGTATQIIEDSPTEKDKGMNKNPNAMD